MNIKVICENQRQGLFFFYCNLTCLKGLIKEKRKGDQKGRKYYFSEDQTIVIVNKDRTLVRYRNDSIYLSIFIS